MTVTSKHWTPLEELMATINAPVVQEEESSRAELTVGRDDVIATLRNLLGNQRHTLHFAGYPTAYNN